MFPSRKLKSMETRWLMLWQLQE
ncbi:hypothetical protein Gohar_007743 [Gossypium harknessii]|uniref:Uncharacterized protein n=1 Tax=Gossypium harknessii TaxID=34285 RepID=A0A7J9GI24_9ROSI|nr:hypothetical protein [Gossypium harknessii]